MALPPWQGRPGLEVDAQAELHLPRVVLLAPDHAPLAWLTGTRILIKTGGWIRWLEVVEDISQQRIKTNPHTLADLGFLGDGQIQIPAREATDYARATEITVHTEHRPPELAIHGLRIGIGVQSRSVAGATGTSGSHAVV